MYSRSAETCASGADLRADLDVGDLKAILTRCLAMQTYRPDTAERPREVVLDGLRAG